MLFSPSEAENMYTVGTISKVHPNGRINYQGQPTNADGSAIAAVAALTASESLQRAVEKLEEV